MKFKKDKKSEIKHTYSNTYSNIKNKSEEYTLKNFLKTLEEAGIIKDNTAFFRIDDGYSMRDCCLTNLIYTTNIQKLFVITT